MEITTAMDVIANEFLNETSSPNITFSWILFYISTVIFSVDFFHKSVKNINNYDFSKCLSNKMLFKIGFLSDEVFIERGNLPINKQNKFYK